MSTFKHPSFNSDWSSYDGQIIRGTINDGTINVARPVSWFSDFFQYDLEFKNLKETDKDALIAILVTKRGGANLSIEGLDGEDINCTIASDIKIKQLGFKKNCDDNRYTVSFSVKGIAI